MSPTVSIIGIIIGLTLMIYLSFKGVSIYLYAPLSAVVVMLFGGLPVWATLTGPYMEGFVGYAKNYFLLFAMASMFAKVMGDSGAAQVIAVTLVNASRRAKKNKELVAMLSLHAVIVILTYGGINLFVITFVMVSIAKSMHEELDIPWHLFYTSMWASCTITMTMLPGTPAAQNLIPIQYLGTDAKAAPMLGILSAIICTVLELMYIVYVYRRCKKKGEGFLPTGAVIAQQIKEVNLQEVDIGIVRALIPSIALLVVLNFFELPSILVALLVGIVAAVVLYWKNLPNVMQTLTQGLEQSIGVTISVCAVVGFGSVVAITPGYASVIAGLDRLPGGPLVQLLIAVNVCAGFAGSASGGLAIGLNSFAQRFLDMGVNPQLIHRVSSIASGGLDSLPHNGAINSSLRIAGLTHKQAYIHAFIECTVIPLVVSICTLLMAMAGIC